MITLTPLEGTECTIGNEAKNVMLCNNYSPYHTEPKMLKSKVYKFYWILN